jgi:hypothetical protein
MIRNASKAKTAAKAIQYWQNKNHTHEVDYDAVREFIKKEHILDIHPITVDEQIDGLLRQAVRTETWKTPRGRRVRKYGVPRWLIEGEMVTLAPTDMRYAKPNIAQTVFDANYEGGVNSLKRVAIELEEYNQYNLFKKSLPDYDWDLTAAVQEARATGGYDDTFEEKELDDPDEE